MDNIVKLILVIALFLIVPRWIWRKRPKLKIGVLNTGENEGSEFLMDKFDEAIKICNELYKSSLEENPDLIKLGENDIFDYHYLYIELSDTFEFSSNDIKELNEYMKGGGFIHFNAKNDNQFIEIKEFFSDYDWQKVEESEFSFCWNKVMKGKTVNYPSSSFEVEGMKIEERWRIFLTHPNDKEGNVNFPCLLACYIIAALK